MSSQVITHYRRFTLLDSDVTIDAEEGALRYVDAFLGQYEGRPSGATGNHSLLVRVGRGEIQKASTGRPVVVHSSSLGHWDIRGTVISQSPERCVVWSSKGLQVRLNDEASVVDLVVDRTVSPLLVGELAFHVCRSIALYRRDSRRGVLLHGAGVVFDGEATIYCGPKRAGKTTFLVESVRRGAVPLSNDRVYLGRRPPLVVESWPGYFSVCEGTILSHAPLLEEARRYDEPTYDLTTLRYSDELVPDFRTKKRLYPKEWFVRALGRRYRWSAGLRQIVFPIVAEDHIDPPIVRGIETSSDEFERSVRSVAFWEGEDPGFAPWHELQVDQSGFDEAMAGVVRACRTARVGAFAVRCNPSQVPEVVQQLAAPERVIQTSRRGS